MFQFHSIPILAHLRQRPYRDMASESPESPPTLTSFPPQSPTPDDAPTEPFRFLDLPLELREQIYSLYFRPADRLRKSPVLESQGFYGGVYDFDLRLQRTCKQIAKESKKVWRREVRTVKIGTPWPSAVNHISSEGLVPIICTDRQADCHNDHHALIQITAPFHQAVPEHTVVLLLQDLHLFTQTWYYSALSYPMLNDRLSTSFTLRDPDMDDVDEGDEKDIPLALQRKLLLPFSQVKGLYSMDIEGYNKTVERELRAAMAIPPPTLQQSCESATKLLHEGDAHLARGEEGAEDAWESYKAAFHAIHILIEGRTRRVLADTFFHAQITTGTYAGQTGMMVRVILRLRLVARMLSVFLTQRNWGEAAFWGMRSVRIMSDTMDTEFEHLLADLVGGDDVGLIYVRAGIALYKMKADIETWHEELKDYEGEEMADVSTLFRVSQKHLRRGKERARKELERYGIPRPFVILFNDPEPSEAGSTTVNVDADGGAVSGGFGGTGYSLHIDFDQ
ncbi:NADH dehydrogenase [ubiquinone] 1 alpha subcomplex assembly factor 3 [Didymella sp. IMI 355093]|nr:NADH dehydrogenase [ubiquinone] 1 alpha subcomplex assembly factor 3 [Didymella sp. IMI 355093]